mmetsp:Transcript_27363/g.78726  ORF Transcript_27363/g.78726 Transcript_27363/m.78726 type:complete len:301 (-) Transcript_27363:1101-2003(-)
MDGWMCLKPLLSSRGGNCLVPGCLPSWLADCLPACLPAVLATPSRDGDCLGQPSRLVRVDLSNEGQCVCDELQGDDGEECGERPVGRDDYDVVGDLLHHGRVVGDADQVGATRSHLLGGVDHQRRMLVAEHQQDHWGPGILVDEGEWTVLERAPSKPFCVYVRYLFDLECALEGHREGEPLAQHEYRRRVPDLVGYLHGLVSAVEGHPSIYRQTVNGVHEQLSPVGESYLLPLLCEPRRDERQHRHLGRERLGRSYRYLTTGVEINTAVGKPGEKGPDDIDDRELGHVGLIGYVARPDGV